MQALCTYSAKGDDMPGEPQLRKSFQQMPYFYQRLLESWLTAASVQEIAMCVGCFTSQVPEAFQKAITFLRASLDTDLVSLDDQVLLDCLFADRLPPA